MQSLGHQVDGDRAHAWRGDARRSNKQQPGLILADIQLADGSSGLDAVNEMLGSFSVPVIFITAYPERLLTGERPEPAFLITKPFQPETREGGHQPGACSSSGAPGGERAFGQQAGGEHTIRRRNIRPCGFGYGDRSTQRETANRARTSIGCRRSDRCHGCEAS